MLRLLFRWRRYRYEKDRQRKLLHAALLPHPTHDQTYARVEIARLKSAGKWLL